MKSKSYFPQKFVLDHCLLRRLSFLLFFLLLSPVVFAAETLNQDATLILKEISQNYKELGNWSAKIRETKTSLGLGASKPQEGEFKFSKPDKFVYELENAEGTEKSSVSTDGQHAWQFQWREGKNTLPTVRYFSNVKNLELERYLIFVRGISLDLKSAEKGLVEGFDTKATRDGQVSTLELRSKGPSSLKRVVLQFIKGRLAPSQVLVEDELDNQTKIEILEYKTQQKFPEEMFRPTIPKGAKVENAD